MPYFPLKGPFFHILRCFRAWALVLILYQNYYSLKNHNVMKALKLMFAVMLSVMFAFAACEEPVEPVMGEGDSQPALPKDLD